MNIESIKDITKIIINKEFDEMNQAIDNKMFYIFDQINETTITDRNGNFIDKNINWANLCNSVNKFFKILDDKNQTVKVKVLDENHNSDELIIGTQLAFANLLDRNTFKSFQIFVENIDQNKLNYYNLGDTKILVLPQLFDWAIGGTLFPDDKLYSISLKNNTLFYISKDKNKDKYGVIIACDSATIYELDEDFYQ